MVMTVRSFQEHVQTLIGRKVAEAKVSGAPSPDIEARAILESIVFNLLLKPKSVLYIAHLARNGLLNVLSQEIAIIDELIKITDDLASITYSISDTKALNKAHTALLNLENLDKIDTSNSAFKTFDSAVNTYLSKTLAKNVRKAGSTELVRTSAEAAADLSSEFQSLKTTHSEVYSRLLSLSVGIENFTRSSLSTVLGLTTVYRAREDLEDIISILENDEGDSQSRDIAVRLIGDRAAIKSVGSLPSMTDPLISTTLGLPSGQKIYGKSPPTAASVISSVGPFTLSPSASASVTVGSTITAALFPQSSIALDNRPFVVSSPGIVFPVTIGSASLFVYITRSTSSAGYVLQADGSYLKQVKVDFTAGAISLAQVIIDLNTALGSDAVAAEYLGAGTGRIILIGNTASTSISISPILVDATPTVYTNSANSLLGFEAGQIGIGGSTPVEILVDAFNFFFGAKILASRTSDQRISISTIQTIPGTELAVTTDTALGVNSPTKAASIFVSLYGSMLGIDTDPINPVPLVDVGDSIITPTGTFTISGLTSSAITLSSAANTFDGNITATSALSTAIMSLESAIQLFMPSWMVSEFNPALVELDRTIAALTGKATPGTRNTAKEALNRLKSTLNSLSSTLTTGSVPSNIGTEEREVVNGIISTLEERKYDRALSLLLQLDFPNFFEVTGDTASFGGSAMKAMSNIAVTDVNFPNTEEVDNVGFKAEIKEPQA